MGRRGRPLLQADPGLNAVTLLEELQRRHPGQYAPSVLRTLQRRLRQWRAVHGAEREVYFAQEHPPGRLGLSDFTVADEPGVVVAGEPFPHRLYQFALAHSGWRHAEVVDSGKSFQALWAGLQAALWRLGGVPEEHRTDSLSAAFNNLAQAEQLTKRYGGLCAHYKMRASRCTPGQSHENGSIEARHGSLKTALDQALRLRGSREFTDRASYDAFVEDAVRRMNARVARRATAEYEEVPARVSKYGVLSVRGVLYSAPSRLIGHRLSVRLYPRHIEGWLGGRPVLERQRLTRTRECRQPGAIDYRHLVGALKKKPGAFARWVLRDAAFPRDEYRRTWQRLQARLPEREACKTIVALLALAAEGHEAQLAQELQRLIDAERLPDVQAITARLRPPPQAAPQVVVELPAPEVDDVLLFGPPGVGKTHLIAGIGHALIDAGRRVLFTRCSELVQRLQAARRDLRPPAELAKLDRFDLLILDDLSYVRRDQAETSVLFELIAERYERRSLAITANTPFSQWGEVFVEPAMTLAAIDRLVHHSTILEMNVESYRRRAAQQGHAPAARNKR